MFYKVGRFISASLYAWFAVLAFKKKPYPLIALFLTHLSEYFFRARPLAREKGIGKLKALCMCLLFGFTWWLPIKKGGA